jgi:hypothetical protein
MWDNTSHQKYEWIGSNVSSLTIAIVAIGKVEWRRSTLRQFNMTIEKSPCVTGKSSINRP